MLSRAPQLTQVFSDRLAVRPGSSIKALCKAAGPPNALMISWAVAMFSRLILSNTLIATPHNEPYNRKPTSKGDLYLMSQKQPPINVQDVLQSATIAVSITAKNHPETEIDDLIEITAAFTGRFVGELFERRPDFTLAELRQALASTFPPTTKTAQSETTDV